MDTKLKKSLYRTSRTVPSEFTLERISVSDLTTAISEFVFENFRGAMTVEKPPLESGYVTVSLHGFAYFLKLLLREIYGDGVLRAKIVTRNGRVEVIINLPCAEKSIDALLSVAVRSGFAVESSGECEIRLFTNTAKDKALSIYAVDFTKFKRYLNEIFFL